MRAGVEVDGVQQPTPLGVPQGGPLSPLLANIVLHELDVYLESQGRRFARYADDFVICVRSTSAAQRVKANVTRFLNKRLKLHINHDKSRVVASRQLEFLGFCFRGTRIVWSDKALHRFKRRVRQLTGRSWGVSMAYRYRELRRYVVGWLNYFALSEYYRPVPELDEWLRRRLRTCYWKQWRWPRTKIGHLVALGIALKPAIMAGVSSKGPYRMSRTKVTQMAMSNAWLTSKAWSQSNTTGPVFITLLQPPSADPHARWCGESRSDTGSYPIMVHAARPLSGALLFCNVRPPPACCPTERRFCRKTRR